MRWKQFGMVLEAALDATVCSVDLVLMMPRFHRAYEQGAIWKRSRIGQGDTSR